MQLVVQIQETAGTLLPGLGIEVACDVRRQSRRDCFLA
jgi:hypothetical protein